jgi:uncharacterized membrane protein
LTTFSGFLIWHSQTARMYTLFACTAMYFVLTTIHAARDPSAKRLVLNALAGILLLHTHVYGSFIFAGINLFVFTALLLKKAWLRVSLKDWLMFQVVTLSVFAPWALNMLIRANMKRHGGFWIPDLSTSFIFEHLVQIANGLPALIVLSLLCLVAISPLNTVHTAPGVQPAQGRHPERLLATFAVDWRQGLALTWLFSSLVFGILASVAMDQNILYDRYLSGSIPAFLLLAALGLRKLQFAKPLLLLALLTTMASLGPALISWLTSPEKSDVRAMISDVSKQLHRQDQVFAVADWQNHMFEYYLRDIENDYYMNVGNEAIVRSGSGFDRLWILAAEFEGVDTSKLRAQMALTHELIHSLEYGECRAYLFQRKGDPSAE